MSVLINRQDAIEAFADMREGYPVVHGDMLSDADVVAILYDLPSADAVEVVRCKDCIMTRMYDSYSRGNWCIIHRNFMQDDYFCADGRREP